MSAGTYTYTIFACTAAPEGICSNNSFGKALWKQLRGNRTPAVRESSQLKCWCKNSILPTLPLSGERALPYPSPRKSSLLISSCCHPCFNRLNSPLCTHQQTVTFHLRSCTQPNSLVSRAYNHLLPKHFSSRNAVYSSLLHLHLSPTSQLFINYCLRFHSFIISFLRACTQSLDSHHCHPNPSRECPVQRPRRDKGVSTKPSQAKRETGCFCLLRRSLTGSVSSLSS